MDIIDGRDRRMNSVMPAHASNTIILYSNGVMDNFVNNLFKSFIRFGSGCA